MGAGPGDDVWRCELCGHRAAHADDNYIGNHTARCLIEQQALADRQGVQRKARDEQLRQEQSKRDRMRSKQDKKRVTAAEKKARHGMAKSGRN